MNVLVTGGAGFIGTHLVRRLLRESCKVTILDNFSPQIHNGNTSLPIDLASDVKLIVGDVMDPGIWGEVLQGQDVVVHFAAETGTGQSMYQVTQYEGTNIRGTVNLIEGIMNNPRNSIGRIVVASSRAVYGEGAYLCETHGQVFPRSRFKQDMLAGIYEPRCPHCGNTCLPRPTNEDAPFRPCSFYGLTKQVQEQMALMYGSSLGISAFALRYQNVYGPGQSLRNPYTGILAIFSTQAMLNRPIQIFEDGLESRDFVYVEDVVDATWRCISTDGTENCVLNVGSGKATTVLQVVEAIKGFFRSDSAVTVTGAFREGDIRHNVAAIEAAHRTVGFVPAWEFGRGVKEFLSWAQEETPTSSNYEASLNEMRSKGLLHA